MSNWFINHKLYCTILYCTVLYCNVMYRTVPYCTVLDFYRWWWQDSPCCCWSRLPAPSQAGPCGGFPPPVLYCTVLYCTVLQVGFLRLFNFLSCCTSVFAVTLSLLFSVSEPAADLRTPVNITTVYTIWAPIDTTTMGRTLAIAITLVSHHLQWIQRFSIIYILLSLSPLTS